MVKLSTNQYLGYILDRLTPLGQLSVRAMFGGHGLYYRGTIFGIIIHDELYFKVGDKNRAEYISTNSSPFIYAGKHKPVTMSYWKVPVRVIESDVELKRWALEAHKESLESKDA